MQRKKWFVVLGSLGLLCSVYGALLLRRGFSARDEPSPVERVDARLGRTRGGD